MSTRPQFVPYAAIPDGSMSGNITSAVTIIQKLSMISYEIQWTGTSPVGEIVVEVSNDYSQNSDGSVKNAGSWTELPLSAAASVSGNSGSGFIDITAHSAYAMRIRYVRDSGDGILNATISAKVA